MKVQIKFIPLLITLGLALLSGYGFYAANANDADTKQFLKHFAFILPPRFIILQNAQLARALCPWNGMCLEQSQL